VAEAQQRADDALESGLTRIQALREAQAAENERLKAQQQAGELEQLGIQREAERTVEQERLDAIRERMDLEEVAAENAKQALEDQSALEQAAAEQTQANLQSTLGPIVQSTTQALASIIAGAQSAEEAFQGLLASFLEMIAQQAALEAVKEFAAAIGSFASQDFASGALHLAAGGAWVAVAALAGGASAAVAPSAPAQPASPEAGRDSGRGGGGGGTQVLQFNAPIITPDGSTDQAEAGRQMGAMVDQGSNRFGRAS